MKLLLAIVFIFTWCNSAFTDALYKPYGVFANILTHWFSGGVSGKTGVIAGDSTTANATTLMGTCAQPGPCTNGYLYTNGQQAGQLLAGTTILNYGNTGATLAAWLADEVPYGITATIAANPNLIVLCLGINDVRLGATSQAQLIVLLQQAVNQLRTALPNTDILLWGPNTLLACNCSGMNYVQPISSAQAYSTILYNAYAAMIGYAPNVAVLQKQDLVVFGKISSSSLTPYMQDELHPNGAGQGNGGAEGDQLVQALGWH